MADRKFYLKLQESWPMALLLCAVALGVLIWWNHRENPLEEGVFLNPPEIVSINEVSPPTKRPALISPEMASPKTATVESSKKFLTIQVRSFQDQAKAQKALDDLHKQGFSAEIIKRD